MFLIRQCTAIKNASAAPDGCASRGAGLELLRLLLELAAARDEAARLAADGAFLDATHAGLGEFCLSLRTSPTLSSNRSK